MTSIARRLVGGVVDSRRRTRPSSLPDAKPDRVERRRRIMVWAMILILLFSTAAALVQVFASSS